MPHLRDWVSSAAHLGKGCLFQLRTRSSTAQLSPKTLASAFSRSFRSQRYSVRVGSLSSNSQPRTAPHARLPTASAACTRILQPSIPRALFVADCVASKNSPTLQPPSIISRHERHADFRRHHLPHLLLSSGSPLCLASRPVGLPRRGEEQRLLLGSTRSAPSTSSASHSPGSTPCSTRRTSHRTPRRDRTWPAFIRPATPPGSGRHRRHNFGLEPSNCIRMYA